MIVVSADNDCFVGMRAFAFDDPNHVLDFCPLANDVCLAGHSPAPQLKAFWSLCGFDFLLERGEVLTGRNLYGAIERLAAAKEHRKLASFAVFAAKVKLQK